LVSRGCDVSRRRAPRNFWLKSPRGASCKMKSKPVTSHTQPGTLLRHSKDRRTVFWALVLFPIPALVVLLAPEVSPLFFLPALYLAFSAGVISHYFNHRPVFHSRGLNAAYSCWLSVFYGFPLFGWVPSHNQNHHKFVNGAGDHTSTQVMKSDGLLAALLYPSFSSRAQMGDLSAYLKRLWRKQGSSRFLPLLQAAALVSAHVGLAITAIASHGFTLGGGAYVALVLGPALFSSWSMMFINYIQHVGCDPSSPDNHSRNFVSRSLNWWVFEAGLHTVHHENPGRHWSEYPSLHEARARDIAPTLLQNDIPSFLVRRYVLNRDTDAPIPLAS